MHELGVIMDIVATVESFAKANGVTTVATLVLQVGEVSSMVPRYLEELFPAAIEGTTLEGASLRIEVIPAEARCRACGRRFSPVAEGRDCPACGQGDYDLLTGREFVIKEIVAC